jgi:hypothetical protein
VRLRGDDQIDFDDESVVPFKPMPRQSPVDSSDYEEIVDEKPRSSRPWLAALVCVLLAATGSAGAFLWRGDLHGRLLFAAAPKAATAPQATAAAASESLLKAVAETQRNGTAIAQSNQALLQAQTAEIERLSDTVSQLTAQVDAIGVRTTQAVVAPPLKKPTPKVVRPKPVAPAPLTMTPEAKQ